MKKILRSILVCAAMIITFGWNTNCVKAEDNIEIYNGVKYRVNNEQKWASVCGYSGDAEDLEIPFMVGRGIIVSQIDDHAFDGCSSVEILTIPDTIVKVGDMSFIGMDNLQAVISTARGINIVVRDNVKIVKDRSQLDNSDNNNGGSSDNNNNSYNNNTSSDNEQGNPGVNNTPEGTGNNGNGSIGTGSAIINSDENVIIDSSNGTVIEENIDKNVADGSTVVGSNDNSKSDNKVNKSEDNVKNKTTKSAKRSQAPKIIAYIVCIIAIIAIAAGALILIKKRRR